MIIIYLMQIQSVKQRFKSQQLIPTHKIRNIPVILKREHQRNCSLPLILNNIKQILKIKRKPVGDYTRHTKQKNSLDRQFINKSYSPKKKYANIDQDSFSLDKWKRKYGQKIGRFILKTNQSDEFDNKVHKRFIQSQQCPPAQMYPNNSLIDKISSKINQKRENHDQLLLLKNIEARNSSSLFNDHFKKKRVNQINGCKINNCKNSQNMPNKLQQIKRLSITRLTPWAQDDNDQQQENF